MRRVQATVSGRVQGVFYRATCVREAEARGLGGYVRNLPDGRVEGVFEGPEAQVDAILAWCREGPPGARVDRVDVVDLEPTGERTFGVRG